jgi:NAD(P)-dependent dehydrogenase (short-subunit alcohol dehydrogenase family)
MKIVLITGAARGIGAATARKFKAEGYTTVGLDIEPEEHPTCAEFHRVSVTDEAAIASLVRDVVGRHGRIDVLANVAGVVLVKALTETTWDDYRRVVDINLGGTFLLMKHVLPVMRKQKSGAVVNVASISGHVGQVDHGVYGSTKAAIIALCRGLAWEFAPDNIRINSISPGCVDTPMLRDDMEIESRVSGRSYQEVKSMREAEQALRRLADPDEIASTIYFLGTAQASFVTGADLLVDGGWTAR